MVEHATSETQVDNERARVTIWRFTPGAATGFHRHAYDYVVVPLASGPLRQVFADGQCKTAHVESGVAYYRQAGVEHDVVYDGDGAFAFAEIEIKG